MRIFLSYASEDRARAEEISLALEGRGHDVFFDRADLSGGEDYHEVIRKRVAGADLFIFLISPRSVRPGAYTLTELRMARERWPHPKGRVLPVLIAPTPLDQVPAYLRGVTVFEPEGNVAAEVAAHLAARRARVRPLTLAAAVLVAAIVAIPSLAILRDHGQPEGGSGDPAAWPVTPADFVTRYAYHPEMVERTEYALDPTGPFGGARGDMVNVQRVAFGTLSETTAALSVHVAIVNTTPEPIGLDITSRFFEVRDDRGRKAELVYFCCTAGVGDILGAGQTRQVELLFRAPPGWHGKETQATRIYFHINGLLPLARGTWSFPTLATAA